MSELIYVMIIWKGYICWIYLLLLFWFFIFIFMFLKWMSTWLNLAISSPMCPIMPDNCPHNERNLVCNSSLFLFWFAVQNVVMGNGLLLCLTGFLAQKRISPQVMRAGRLCQEKMRMNLSYRVIVVALKKRTKNCLFRRGMSYSEINFLNVCYARMAFATFKCWMYINYIISSCVEQVVLWYL